MTSTLLPQAFWFRVAASCPRVEGIPRAGSKGPLLDLPGECALPELAALDGRELFEHALGSGESRAAQAGTGADADGHAIAGRAASGDGKKHLIGHRREQGSESRPARLDQRDRHRPVVPVRDVGARAVDRIDDPGSRHRARGRIVLGFFRQPPGLRRQSTEPRPQEIIDGDVALADR